MITLFTIPKAFVGHIGVIQKNAIRSWTKLPGCQVILFGEEENLAETAAELGVQHEVMIERNEFGTPMVSDAFDRVRELAKFPVLAYVNSDIIFTGDFAVAANTLQESTFSTWLMVGQRHDIDYSELLDFSGDWEERMRQDVVKRGVLHGKAGIDYFLFPSNFPVHLPPLAVGRPGWDSWFIYQTKASGIPLVDATKAVLTVHQNHPSAYRRYGAEAQKNKEMAGGYYRMGTLRDSNYTLVQSDNGRFNISRRYIATLYSNPVSRLLFSIKRQLNAWVNR